MRWNSFWAWILIIFTILAHLTSWNSQIWHFLSVLVIFGDFCSRQFLGGIVVPKSQFLDCIWKFRFRPTSGYPWFIRGGRTYPLKMASKNFDFQLWNFWAFLLRSDYFSWQNPSKMTFCTLWEWGCYVDSLGTPSRGLQICWIGLFLTKKEPKMPFFNKL